MNSIEIDTFIELMEEVNDIWTPEEVRRCYGNGTLEEAVLSRKQELKIMGNIYEKVVNA